MNSKNWFNKIKLNKKLTLVAVIAVALPVTLLASVLFFIMKNNVISENINSMQYKMQINERQLENCEDVINMSTQFILSDAYMHRILNSAYRGEGISAIDIINFQETDVTNIERLVNNNPLLYAVRVFDVKNKVQEMMPILYRSN